MKKKKLFLLITLLLLICLKSWSREINDSIVPTGDLIETDTTVTINIDLLRNANVKLIERIEFKDIIEHQNIIINNQKNIIDLKDNTIINYIKQIDDVYKVNLDLKKNIAKYKTTIYVTGSVCLVVGVILGIIIK